MITYGEWTNLLNYYIQCVEKEITQQTKFDLRGEGTKFIFPQLEEENFITNSSVSTNLEVKPIIKQFIQKAFFKDRSTKLFYAYPSLIYANRGNSTIIPVFIHEVKYEHDLDFDILTIRKKHAIPDFNISILFQENFAHEEAYKINNQIAKHLQTKESSIPEEDHFLSILQEALSQTQFANQLNFHTSQLMREPTLRNKTYLYNQPMLFWGEANFIYQYLLDELSQLKKQEYYEDLAKTSLSYFFQEPVSIHKQVSTIYSVLPLDKYQENAIKGALSQDLTVISGPPGTGKSQVLVNLVVNATLNDQSIIFSSKNNKAVDVVNERINKLTDEPYVVRTGNKEMRISAFEQLSRHVKRISYGQLSNSYKELKEETDEVLNQIENLTIKKSHLLKLEEKIEEIEKQLSNNQFIHISSLENIILSKNNIEIIYQLIKKGERVSNNKRTFIEIFNDLLSSNKTKDKLLNKINKILFDSKTSQFKIKTLNDIPKLRNNIELLTMYHSLKTDLLMVKKERKLYKNKSDYTKAIQDKKRTIYDLTSKLYAQKWPYKLSNTPVSIKKDLDTYIEAQKKINDDSPYFRKGLQSLTRMSMELLPNIIKIISVWGITNLTVKKSLPLKAGLFDIAVIDEASQCDIPSAIPILYRAKKVVIIGDEEQLQHITSISDHDDDKIAERNDITTQNTKFSYKNGSLYHLAEKSYYSHPINLLGHYRSEPEIIQFSNQNFYNKSLEIFTNTSNFSLSNRGVCWKHFEGNAKRLSPGNIENREEADYVVKILLQLIAQYGPEISYGVITPFTKQHIVISDILHRETKQSDLSKYDITIYTAHKFQGDEKDIIIFSPTIMKGLPKGTIDFVDQQSNLLNVTVTRARQKFIVIGDFKFAISRSGYLHKLATYIENLGKVEGVL